MRNRMQVKHHPDMVMNVEDLEVGECYLMIQQNCTRRYVVRVLSNPYVLNDHYEVIDVRSLSSGREWQLRLADFSLRIRGDHWAPINHLRHITPSTGQS